MFFCNFCIIYFTSRIPWIYRIYVISTLLKLSKLLYLFRWLYLCKSSYKVSISFLFWNYFRINNYSFRLAYLISYVTFISILFFRLKNIFNNLNSFLVILSISTIPIYFNASTILEKSLWGFIAITLYLFVTTFEKKFNLKNNLFQSSIFFLF